MSLYKELVFFLIIDRNGQKECCSHHGDNCRTENHRLVVEIGCLGNGATYLDFLEAVEKKQLDFILNQEEWILEMCKPEEKLYFKMDSNDRYDEIIKNGCKIRARRLQSDAAKKKAACDCKAKHCCKEKMIPMWSFGGQQDD